MTRFLDPTALLWFVVLLIGCVLLMKRRRVAGLVLVALCAGWWAADFARVPAKLLARLERPYAGTGPEPGVVYDVIVVLGGGTSRSTNEFAGLNFSEAADRVLTGVELARQGHAKHLVLGGSSRRTPEVAPEPDLLQEWIRRWELTEVPLSVLGYCRNTRDEAVRMAEMARENGWQRILLVTSAAHLARAEGAFEVVGLEVRPVGCDFVGMAAVLNATGRAWVPQTGSLVMWENWLHEVVGMQYYRLRGWVRGKADKAQG